MHKREKELAFHESTLSDAASPPAPVTPPAPAPAPAPEPPVVPTPDPSAVRPIGSI